MNSPLTYLPAYLGLFAALSLAVVCNVFLDIQYGSFGFEVVFWGGVFAWTVSVGWRQRGQADERGARHQKIVLAVGLALSLFVFIPKWGFPRAGIYMLAVLQAAMNCVTTTRRQLQFGLLVSVVMVIFAASHHRADWTMAFYLIPYVVAVVFTLVSEQISRRAQDMRQASLGDPGHAGQGLAIASATATILALGALLYLATPQLTRPYLAWRYGQLTNIGLLGGQAAHSGRQPAGGAAAAGSGGQESGAAADPTSGDGQGGELAPGFGWPTPEAMREAARRPGMPAWQAAAIMRMSSLDEAIGEALAPLKEMLSQQRERLREWLQQNRATVVATLIALLVLALLLALAVLLREVKALAWLRTRADYLYLYAMARHKPGACGAVQFYRATERLFLVRDLPRAANANTREFLREVVRYREAVRPEMAELTRLFEECRYGPEAPDRGQVQRMRVLYGALFRKLA